MTLKAIDSANPGLDGNSKPKPYIGVQFAAIPEFQGIATAVGQQFAAALVGQMSAGSGTGERPDADRAYNETGRLHQVAALAPPAIRQSIGGTAGGNDRHRVASRKLPDGLTGMATFHTRSLARLMIAPSVALLFLWMAVPLAMTLYFSFIRYNLLIPGPQSFAGFSNYYFFLTDPAFVTALVNTLIIVGGVLLITIVGGIAAWRCCSTSPFSDRASCACW